jgi:hypothetical protein
MRDHIDFSKIYLVFTGEGNYINCSNKTPEEIKPKDQGFDEVAEKIVDISSDNSNNGLNLGNLSFKDLFNSKYKSIM